MEQKKKNVHIGIIGGGIAGSTVALRFSELGVGVTLFEQGPSLINGPPICHLHSGGNLYREISESQCVTLLKECIDTLRVFPHTINYRPTMISVPNYDKGDPSDILPRLMTLRETYRKLVEDDSRNIVLGNPDDYFKTYNHEDILRLRNLKEPQVPKTFDDWMVPVSRHLELEQLKFPIIMVQEYGWSILRMAAVAELALEKLPNCNIMTNTKVLNVEKDQHRKGWTVTCEKTCSSKELMGTTEVNIDYLVNACGYKTGTIDNFVGVQEDRMVEFKAAYISDWNGINGDINSSHWPEIIVHGTRGTPNGMMQLTPYPDNVFQLHGMTKDITLFPDGLAKSSFDSSQPTLSEKFNIKLESGWDPVETCSRTKKAIEHATKFIPAFSTASVSGPPLFGAQQIPGKDPSLRAASVSFPTERYARVEIVKGSSTLGAADTILQKLVEAKILNLGPDKLNLSREKAFSTVLGLKMKDVVEKAENIAICRKWPLGLARLVGNPNSMSKGKVNSLEYVKHINYYPIQEDNFISMQTNSAVVSILRCFYYYLYHIPRAMLPLTLRPCN